MTGQPARDLIEDLGEHLSDTDHKDTVLCSGRAKKTLITPEEFVEIRDIDSPKRTAFVDGGDGTLEESPNFLITINRIYFSLFCGKSRIKPRSKSRVQFFSCVTSSVSADQRASIRYDTRLFPYSKSDERYLPDESALASKSDSNAVLQGSRINSLSRSFAEWRLARHVVDEELEKGDVIVMDGSLQTSFKNESAYTEELYRAAVAKGVIVCGLSKTSRLVTESGEPLLARIEEIAKDVKYGRWYVRVAEETAPDNKGYVLAVKLHPKSQYVYRFEILREQFKKMNQDEIGMVLGSLAENSEDVAMLGYPYGLIDADRFAQVRYNELGMYRSYIRSEMMRHPGGKKMLKYSTANQAHDHLNGVTS
ncbi:MAG: DNA double-strand break repair nuclease NurA [Nitrosopumilus sp. H13]|nr:MAG: DNA double-strand break repair nuclease NurA [Nitrosopumilus sp. H13]